MFSINVSDRLKKDLSVVIGNVLTYDMKDYKIVNDLLVQNGIHFFFWDKVYTSILKGEVSDAKPILLDTSIWKFTVLIDPATKTIFTIFKDKRLMQLIKEFGTKEQPHYSYVFNDVNPSINEIPHLPNSNYQGEIFPLSEDEGWVNRITERKLELLGEYASVIENHVIISFSNSGKEITDYKATLFTKEMEIADSQNWNEFIVPIINNESLAEQEDNIASKEEEPHQEETLVALKSSNKHNVET